MSKNLLKFLLPGMLMIVHAVAMASTEGGTLDLSLVEIASGLMNR